MACGYTRRDLPFRTLPHFLRQPKRLFEKPLSSQSAKLSSAGRAMWTVEKTTRWPQFQLSWKRGASWERKIERQRVGQRKERIDLNKLLNAVTDFRIGSGGKIRTSLEKNNRDVISFVSSGKFCFRIQKMQVNLNHEKKTYFLHWNNLYIHYTELAIFCPTAERETSRMLMRCSFRMYSYPSIVFDEWSLAEVIMQTLLEFVNYFLINESTLHNTNLSSLAFWNWKAD